MKIKTRDLTGPALNWAVAKCEGRNPMFCGTTIKVVWANDINGDEQEELEYSTDWAQGGPIIERMGIASRRHPLGGWSAMLSADLGDSRDTAWSEYSWNRHEAARPRPRRTLYSGPTQLIACLRVLVACKLGGEVEIPEELQTPLDSPDASRL